MPKLDLPVVAGYYTDPDAFVQAAAASTKRGWNRAHDGYMPYPVHAAFEALALPRSLLGRPVLALLLIGAFLGFMMQYWMMKMDWPIWISGKPFNSWPAWVVITFESGVLLGAVGNLALLILVYTKLRPDPVTRVRRQRLTDDTFCLVVPVGAGRSEEDLRSFFAEQGAEDVELVTSLDRDPAIPPLDPAPRVPRGQVPGLEGRE